MGETQCARSGPGRLLLLLLLHGEKRKRRSLCVVATGVSSTVRKFATATVLTNVVVTPLRTTVALACRIPTICIRSKPGCANTERERLIAAAKQQVACIFIPSTLQLLRQTSQRQPLPTHSPSSPPEHQSGVRQQKRTTSRLF